MKRIMVLSDSHRGMSFMRWCVNTVKPDAIVHLGDYFEDGQDLHEEYPMIPFYQVPGNCDRYRVFGKPELMCVPVFGAMLDAGMTSGIFYGSALTLALGVASAAFVGIGVAARRGLPAAARTA